jgi:hypothetical protein
MRLGDRAAEPVPEPDPDLEPRALEFLSRPGAPVLDQSARWESLPLPDYELHLQVQPTMALRLDPTGFGILDTSARERDLPAELPSDLRALTPQALLRDLHRPVLKFEARLEPREGSELLGRWQEARGEFLAALRREPIPWVEGSVVAVTGDLLRRRALHTVPWQPHLPDEAPRREIDFYALHAGFNE